MRGDQYPGDKLAFYSAQAGMLSIGAWLASIIANHIWFFWPTSVAIVVSLTCFGIGLYKENQWSKNHEHQFEIIIRCIHCKEERSHDQTS